MNTSNLKILGEKLIPTPQTIKNAIPISQIGERTVTSARSALEAILDGKDKRIVLVVGPCSIHDSEAALEYADRLKTLSLEVSDTFLIIMRAYFEKPRTTVGWKGFINDPLLDDSFKIDLGLHKARELLLKINQLGVPTGTEALDPITPQYLDDLVSWTAIGARTTESQTHREMASGLSTPVGFKNGTDGNIQVAINALLSAKEPHHFLGINQNGQCAVMQTAGNPYGHIVLRGGIKPNYDKESLSNCEMALTKAGVRPEIFVDCSHGNSLKDHTKQPSVFQYCIDQIIPGDTALVGLMLESNLLDGNQSLGKDPTKLVYGRSITDACIDWKTTEKLILESADKLRT